MRLSGGVAVLLPTGSENVVASRAWGINERGDIVGARLFATGNPGSNAVLPRATLWRRSGEVVDLGTLDAGRGSEAYAINNRGEAVGVAASNSLSGQPSSTFRPVRPVIFEDGKVIDLGGSPSCTGAAYAVNEAGHVAGRLCNRATVWVEVGSPIALDIPLGAIGSAAFGINNSDDVVGRIVFALNPEDPYRNYLIRGPALEEPFVIDSRLLSTTGAPSSSALPALWQGEELTILPTLTGKFRQQGAAYAINNRGQIVGVNLVDETMRAVMWTISGSLK